MAIATLVASIVGAVTIGNIRAPETSEFSFFGELGTIALGLVVVGLVMIGAGVTKLVIDEQKKKEIGMQKNPELESPRQTMNDVLHGTEKAAGNAGSQFQKGAEKIGEKIGQGANKLGIEIGKIFNEAGRPNTSANPYSSTINNNGNPYSSRDRMSAGYGGTYNGQNYGPSMTGDVRNSARQGQNGQSGGYYSGRNNQNYRQNNYSNNNYSNNQNYNQNVQYGSGTGYSTGNYGNNRPNENNNNVQYGNYRNSNSQKVPNTSGLEGSAQSNYFENEPGYALTFSMPSINQKGTPPAHFTSIINVFSSQYFSP